MPITHVPTGFITARVVVTEGPKALAAATLTVRNIGTGQSFAKEVNVNNDYEFPVPPGKWAVSAQYGAASGGAVVEVKDGETTELIEIKFGK